MVRPASATVPLPGPPGDERFLVEGLVARAPESLAEFLERTHHPVFYMACRITRDPDLRRDWTHAVLLEVIDDLARGRFVYTQPGSFWAWFRKRAFYRLLDQYRRHRRQAARECTASGDPESEEWAAVAGVSDPAAEFERVELRNALEACLETLASGSQRSALTMLFFEDLSYAQIAQGLAAPINTVRAWIRRGRIAVRECLSRTFGLGPEAAGR